MALNAVVAGPTTTGDNSTTKTLGMHDIDVSGNDSDDGTTMSNNGRLGR